jgi:lysophospholipase L1-like esterase
MKNNFKWLLFASVAIVACSDEVEEKVVEAPITPGSANFTTYVALGNSLTAGFSDNALFIKGQENSFPNILATEFAKAGGGDFKIPFMADNLGGFQSGGVQVPGFGTRLFFNGSGPQNVPGVPTTNITASIAAQGPYNNMGVPGAKSFHLAFPGYGTLNPYFGRFASSATATVLGDAMAQNPTFFSLWIGNNDVLGFATTGGDGTNPITDQTTFDQAYNNLVTTLVSGGAKGVIANIPNVTSIPYFRTVPYNPITALSLGRGLVPNGTQEQQIAAGTAAINQLNSSLLAPLRQILSLFGQEDRIVLYNANSSNPLLIVDEDLTNLSAQITGAAQASGVPQLVALAPFLGQAYGQARHAKQTDLVCLPTSSIIGTSAGSPVPDLNRFGVSFPLQDVHILIPSEQTAVLNATTAFNNTIRAAAEANGLAFVDANAIVTQIASGGYQSGGFLFKSDFIFGNTFSLDGVHLSPRANGLVANKMIEAINATYGSNFRPVRLSAYPILYGVTIP